jgi:hypothetical protein
MMKKLLNSNGFSLVESIAAIFIITLLLTSSVAMIINIRNNTKAMNEKIIATQVGTLIRDDIIANLNYSSTSTWMAGLSKIATSSTCGGASAVSCSFFQYTSGNKIYDTELVITFQAPTVDDLTYRVIHFTVEITYYQSRKITLVGMIYE